MHIEDFQAYCLAKPATSEDFPFDEVTLCMRVGGKIFAITGLDDNAFKVNLKCDPAYAEELREQYEDIQPGFHMNKKHWNTVNFEGLLSPSLLRSLIDHSYDLVVRGIKKSDRIALGL